MKAKILIIEDDENIRKNLVLLLSMNEYSIVSNNSAEPAIDYLKQNIPDLILCDINLPKMNGFEFKQYLNESPDTFDIPFIFLTSRNTYEDLRKGMKLAADDYIYKPFRANDVLESVELRLLKRTFKDIHKDEEFVFIKTGKLIKKIMLCNISVIFGENQYSRVKHALGKDYLTRRSLNKWEDILPQAMFIRINRSAIINKNRIDAIENSAGSKFVKIQDFSENIKITNLKILDELGLQ